MTADDDRFSDQGETIYDFSEEFLVVCPRCAALAKVIPVEPDSKEFARRLFAPRRLICSTCVYRDLFNGRTIGLGANVDWYFRQPLWLQISCCGETLWAYNLKHLEFIENYVAAKLRRRTPNINKSMASRLPQWLKSAKNRDEIFRAIAKLKGKLDRQCT